MYIVNTRSDKFRNNPSEEATKQQCPEKIMALNPKEYRIVDSLE